jgi:hypothetical protein
MANKDTNKPDTEPVVLTEEMEPAMIIQPMCKETQ